MSDILNMYPVFERNQVLTSTQLNNLVNYLDQQNRLTRARLIGMGVVCGLVVKYENSEGTITISKGTGITSEGYLISLGECVTVKYRPYFLPAGTIYEPFVDSDNKQDILLYELLTDSAKAGANDKKLNDATFLADKVVLLFIESFDKDLKSCLGKSCDELGKERILTLRKLLISKADLQKVWNRTNTGKLDAVFPEKFKLPVINMPRVLFDPDKPHSTDYKEFSKNYADTVLSVFDELFKAFSQTYDIYRPLLIESYNEKNPFTNNPIINKLAKLQNFLFDLDPALNSYIGVQYVYDLFQDLINAYNEFKNAAFDLMTECCPDMSRFPKHLMLGEAILPSSTLCENSEYRHHFIQPPVYNLQKLLVQRTISLHNRIVLMVESFDLKRINGFKGADGKSFPVRITPSLEKTTLLSLRSVPWYYNVNKSSSYSALGTLKDYWNFDVSRKCADESGGLVLNYDDQANDQSVAKDKQKTPLFYDIQDYPFLRIEGQIGVNFNIALNRLEALKSQFNLPFNLMALQLDTNAGLIKLDYRCGFEDLQEEYKILKLGFCRFTSDIKEIYAFFEKNQDIIFNDEEGNDPSKYLEKVKEIVEILVAICDSLNGCLEKFDFAEFQERYKLLLDTIIDILLVDLELLGKIKINEKDADNQIMLINGLIQRLSPLVNKIVDLMFYNRFLRLYYSFKRREFYLKKATGVFSANIRKHPGIEHQAGVPRGGTFILVYINDAKNSVIADFNLPYLCCNKDNCIPMCDDSEGGFVFEPEPFARPDYAITLVDKQVDIDVLRNDFHLFGGNFVISDVDTSGSVGKVKQNSETGPLTYIPKKGFFGTDTFTYTLTDKKTGNSDKAKVTVVVQKPGQVEGCYSVEILECWGEKSVRETLNERKIKIPEGANIYELLLNDLKKTGGFTEEEIFSSVLEEPERRRALLNCLGIPNDDNTSYEQLGQLILDYQKANCGSVQPTTECYTVAILQCWGDESVKDTLNHREIEIPNGANMFEVLLNDLRKTGGFTESEISSSVLEDEQRRRNLLNCLGIPNDNLKYDQLGQLILDYQKNNCGSVKPATECYNIGILQCWGETNVQRVLRLREINATGDIFQLLLESLRQTQGFIQSELLKLPEQMFLELLNCMQITVPADKKPIEVLIEYQSNNCQAGAQKPAVSIEAGILSVNDLVKVLEARGVVKSATEPRTVLEEALATSARGNDLSVDEMMILSKNSITGILGNKKIAFSASENKTQLIKKLLA